MTFVTFAVVVVSSTLAYPSRLAHGHKAVSKNECSDGVQQTEILLLQLKVKGNPRASLAEAALKKKRAVADANTSLVSGSEQQTDADTYPALQSEEEFDRDFPEDSSSKFLGPNATAALSDFNAEEEVEEERSEVLGDTTMDNSTFAENSTADKELERAIVLEESAKRTLSHAEFIANETGARRDRLNREYERIHKEADQLRLEVQDHSLQLRELAKAEVRLKNESAAAFLAVRAASEQYDQLISLMDEAKKAGPALLHRMADANRTETITRKVAQLATSAADDADWRLFLAKQNYSSAREALLNIHAEASGDETQKDNCIRSMWCLYLACSCTLKQMMTDSAVGV